ncbi:MAG: HlyC/CorC family transporter [Clostridiales bacterium]|nr:HlyC/CorC family transporter [Clostridiales bacterium]MBR4009288.1 HlyC/CorC family transporter [Clostridiales bacterium]
MPEDSIGRIILDLVIVFIFILINAFFSAAEMAVISLNDAKIKKQAEDGDKKSKRVLRFIENPASFLATIQVGVTLAGFLASAFAANRFTGRLTAWLDPDGKYSFLGTVCTVIVTLILSYFSLVLGELVPKRIAQNNAEKLAFRSSSIVRTFGTIMKPFVRFLTISTNAVLRLLHIDPEVKETNVTEEEIRMLVDVGSEEGSIEDSEKQMIQNIFEFNDKDVAEIMTHRKQVVALPIDSTYEEVMDVATNEKYTRIPVYKETIDEIVGILHIKDLLGVSNDDGGFSLEKIMRPPLFVHETKKISDLFHEMKKGKMQLAVIVDEYGGTMGIATIEDMLEEIVGNITDEFDEEEQELLKMNDGGFLVRGDMTLSDLEEAIGVDLVSEDYDTIAGLTLSLLDRVPDHGETPEVQYKNLKIKVIQVEENWISKLLLHVIPEEPDEEEKEDEE